MKRAGLFFDPLTGAARRKTYVLGALLSALYVGVVGTIVYVIIHFVVKYW